jgi:hypothetical protein
VAESVISRGLSKHPYFLLSACCKPATSNLVGVQPCVRIRIFPQLPQLINTRRHPDRDFDSGGVGANAKVGMTLFVAVEGTK